MTALPDVSRVTRPTCLLMSPRPVFRLPASWAAAAACAGVLAWPAAALAQPSHKVASELQWAIDAKVAPRQPWVREAEGQRWVRVHITGPRTRGDLPHARKDIAARGGTVISYESNTATVTAILPASQVRAFAARPDVIHVAPLRPGQAEGAAQQQAQEQYAAKLAAVGFGPTSLRARSDRALVEDEE